MMQHTLGAAIACLLFAMGGLTAQELTIPSAPSCPACTIRLRPVASLGRAGDPVDVDPSGVVVQRPGGYAIAPAGDRAQIALYLSSGAFERVLGRQGQGPGEFNNIRSLALLPNAGIAVLDNRLTLLTPAGSLIVSKSLPAIIAGRLVALADGRLVVNNYQPAHAPLCLLGADLSLARCFGGAATPGRMAPKTLERLLAPGDRATIWSGTMWYRYVIERYDTLGHRITRIQREAPWFPASGPEEDPGGSVLQSRPLPHLSGLWVDAQGRIWTAVLVPDPRWRAAETGPPSGREGRAARALPVSDWGKYLDTILEVIDPATARVIVSQRFPGVMERFTRDGLLTEFRETEDGLVQAALVRPEVVRSGPSRR